MPIINRIWERKWKMKKFACIICICFVAVFNSHVMAKTLYLLDDTSAEFDDTIAQELLSTNLYFTEPTVKMENKYKTQQRLVNMTDAEKLREEGWHQIYLTPLFGSKGALYYAIDDEKDDLYNNGWISRVKFPETAYIPDGKVRMYTKNREWAINVDSRCVDDFTKKGWYTVTTLYYADGTNREVLEWEYETAIANGGYTEPVTTVYKADGSEKVVLKTDVEKMVQNGWSTEPLVMVYTIDGRKQFVTKSEQEKNTELYSYPVIQIYDAIGTEKVVPKSESDKWLADGWYTEPHKTVYAADGRSEIILKSDVEAWKNVGWYEVPVTTMYAEDGRTAVIPESEVDAWKKVGWYGVNVLVYAPDGRCENILFDELQAWKDVGWYTYPVMTVYAEDGRTQIIAKSELDAWKSGGWYEYAVVRMYSAFYGSVVIPKYLATEYENNGWRYVPMTLMFSTDGSYISVPTSEVGAYEKVGWYSNSLDADYVRFLQEYNQYINNKDFSNAMDLCEWHLDDVCAAADGNSHGLYVDVCYYNSDSFVCPFKNTKYAAMLYELKSQAMDKWRAACGTPVAAIQSWVDTSKRDERKVHIWFKNLSYKTVQAIQFSYTCYDVFKEPISSRTGYYVETAWLSPGEGGGWIWDTKNTNTYEVGNIKVTSVRFTDGTVWSE